MSDNLQASAFVLILYDVSDEIRLEELRRTLGARNADRVLKHAAPEYLRLQRPPVVEGFEEATLESGEKVRRQVKYYDYGVISILFEARFCTSWEELPRLASRWMSSGEFEQQALRVVQDKLKQCGAAIVKPYSEWISEDYFIFNLSQLSSDLLAPDLLAQHGDQIAEIVRGETRALSADEQREVLHSSISYYPTDLAVIGWHAAFLYDTPEGAQPSIQLLEYANSQLLEFRYYDELLSRETTRVYKFLERPTGILRHWHLAREATRLQRVTVEVRELAERAENAVKFLSDMFAARLYKLAAAKVGVLDYRTLVEQKLRTAASFYEFMIGEFHQTRTFVLEVLVVIILVVELIFLFFVHP